MVCFLIAAPTHAQHILYVDAEAPGPTHDGSNWCEAFLYLQDALATAASLGDKAVEIRVAQGVYTPDRDTANPNGTDGREATFQLLDGVALRGGYVGERRNPARCRPKENGESCLIAWLRPRRRSFTFRQRACGSVLSLAYHPFMGGT